MPISDYAHAYNNGWRDGRKALLEEQKAARATSVKSEPQCNHDWRASLRVPGSNVCRKCLMVLGS